MNILFVQPRITYYVGGDELRCMRTTLEYAKRFPDDKLTVLTLKSSIETKQYLNFRQNSKLFPNLKVYELDIPLMFHFTHNNPTQDSNKWHIESHAFCAEVHKWLCSTPVDVIWSFFISDMFVRPHTIPTILNQSGYFCDDYIIRSTMFQMYDAVVCISTNVKNKWNERLPVPFRQVFVLNSSPLVDFSKVISINNFESDKKINLLFVGRLIESKGVKDIIDCLPIVQKRYPNTILTIVGGGPELNSLKYLIDKNGLKDSVHFTGEVSEVVKYYEDAHILLAPSYSYEGFMNVVIEAMFYGLPVITTKGNGNEDIIEDNLNGVLIEPQNPTILASAIVKLLENPVDTIKMGVCARDTIIEKLSWEDTVQKLRDIMETVVLTYKNYVKN